MSTYTTAPTLRRLLGLLIAGHRPPKRTRAWWRLFDRALARRVRRARRAGRWVIAGLDANEGDPQELARRTGLEWHSTDPHRIDGMLASADVKVIEVKALPKDTSDHQPLVVTVEIGGVRFLVGICNDDWETAGTNFPDLAAAGCDVVLIQEGKRAHYAKLVGRGWIVRQSWLNLGRAGSVILIRKGAPLELGRFGWTLAVIARGLLPRWLAWERCEVTR